MARLNVNPTRMELTRLKARLNTARRGHKLLKDKRDELMKNFLDIIRENKRLRKLVEEALLKAHESFTFASALMSPEMLEQSLLYPKQSVALDIKFRNIMSVNAPVYDIRMKSENPGDIYPYGFAQTSARLDDALDELSQVFKDMLMLAQIEKTVQLLAAEIEKTRRRVGALEHVVIPQLEETIKFISMKLDENERGNLIRLMKVKDMMIEQELSKKRQGHGDGSPG